VATSPLPPLYTLKAACLNFGMWGRVLDVINHAKFQLDRFRGFGALGGRESLSPIDWRYRPYNSVCTNVLHCDIDLTQSTAKNKRRKKTQSEYTSEYSTQAFGDLRRAKFHN